MTEAPPIRSRVTLVLPHPDGKRVLALDGALPALELEGSAWAGVGVAVAARSRLGLEVRPLRRLTSKKAPDSDGFWQREFVWAVEGVVEGGIWVSPSELPPEQRAWAEAALAPAPAARPLWQRTGGQAQLLAWLAAELVCQGLSPTGEPETLKHSQISLLWQVETGGGPLYLKAVPGFFGREVPLTALLGLSLPGAAPRVLAADRELGALLMEGGGDPLAINVNGWGESSSGRVAWTEGDSCALLKHLGRVQRASLPLLPELRALGLPQHDPAYLLSRLPVLTHPPTLEGLESAEVRALEAATPHLKAVLTRLERSPLPLTLTHHDLHEGNVLRRPDGSFTLIDWSDGAVSHPFLDANPAYLVPPEHREAAAEAYLEVWADLTPVSELRLLLKDAALAGEFMRVLGYTDGIYLGVEDSSEWGGEHLQHLGTLLELVSEAAL